jgi:hypothetical protein
MHATPPRRFVVARAVATALFAIIVYAITIPNCYVHEFAGRPAHFWWFGLVPPTVLVGLVTFAIWIRR